MGAGIDRTRDCSSDDRKKWLLRKKRAFERRLEIARFRFANAEPRADRVLARAENFKIGPADALDVCTHRGSCQLRRVAIARKMAKHHALDFPRKQLLDHAGGGGVGKMAMPRHDALFHRPGTMRVILQKFFVVIGLDDKCVHFAQTFDQHLGRVTQIGDKPEPAIADMKSIADRLDRVVGDGESLDENVANSEFSAGPKDAPVSMFRETFAANGLSGLRVAINRDGKFAAKHFEPANVITVLMGEQNAVELVRRDTALFEPDDDLARAQPAINENATVSGRNKSAIAGASAAEHGEAEHA
jgi:hypothetical protein